jgi:DNA modification methylase
LGNEVTSLDQRLARFGWRVERISEGWELEGNGSPAVFRTEDSLRAWLEKQEKGKTMQQSIPYLNEIVTGDARELSAQIPDDSIDLIFTDPPYPKQFDGAFSTLASFAGRVLKPGGRLMFLVGHYQLPLAITEISRVLTYDWIIAQAAPGKTAAMFQKRVWASWKPCLVFRKGTITNKMNFAMDLFTDTGEAFRHSKQFHKWGQGAGFFAYYIDRWTQVGDVILEPFAGGGTTAAVCKSLNRNYIAFEIDPDAAARARTRVANTQAIDPVFLEEQAVLL